VIVCPDEILHQWKTEFLKHVCREASRLKQISLTHHIDWPAQVDTKNVDLVIYDGVRDTLKTQHSGRAGSGKRGAGAALASLNGRRLAEADVVLTSFHTLRADIDYVSQPRGSLRYEKLVRLTFVGVVAFCFDGTRSMLRQSHRC
jgi:hypothetical protein